MAGGRARYRIQSGKEIIEFEGPDGLTDKQIEDLATSHLKDAHPGKVIPHAIYTGVRKSDEPVVGEEDSSALGSLFRGVPHGVFANWDDEFTAAGNAAIPGLAEIDSGTGLNPGQVGPMSKGLSLTDLIRGKGNSFSDRYKQNMDLLEEQRHADEELHLTASTIGQGVGIGLTLPVMAEAAAAHLPQAVKAAALAHPVLANMAIGAGAGGVSAAGAGRGNRTQSAALGTVAGAVTGGVVAGAANLAPAVAHYVKIIANKVPHAEAIAQITRSLKRDGFDVVSPAGVHKLKTLLQSYMGKPVSLADIGAATRARTGVGLRSPSEVQEQSIDKVFQRQAGQGQRLASDIRATVAPRTDVHALNDALVEQRSAQAQPLREAALFENDAGPPLLAAPEPSLSGSYAPSDTASLFHVTNRDAANKIALEGYNPSANNAFGLGVPDERGLYGWSSPERAAFEMKRFVDAGADPADLVALKFDLPRSEFGSRLAGDANNVGVGVPFDASMSEGSGLVTGPVDPKYISQRLALPEALAAFGKRSRIVDDSELQNLARLPDAQKALQGALQRAESERALLATQGKDISHLPDLHPGADLDVRTFDYLKRFLDDEVNTLYRKSDTATFKAGQAAQVKALRDAIRERLRQVVPEYGNYLDAYKGSSEMIDALEEGQNFNQLPHEQIAAQQADRSVAGQELYRVGAARNLLDTIRDTRHTGGSPANRILNSDEELDQLGATGVAPVDLSRLNTAVGQERILDRLPRELQGSNTNQRNMAQADADAGAHAMIPFNPGSKYGWLGLLGRKILEKTSTERNASVNQELLPRMLETNPAAISGIIKELEDQGQVAAARQLRRQYLTTRTTLFGGVNIGGPVALPGDQ